MKIGNIVGVMEIGNGFTTECIKGIDGAYHFTTSRDGVFVHHFYNYMTLDNAVSYLEKRLFLKDIVILQFNDGSYTTTKLKNKMIFPERFMRSKPIRYWVFDDITKENMENIRVILN